MIYKMKIKHDNLKSYVSIYRLVNLCFFKFWVPWDGASIRGEAHDVFIYEFVEKFAEKYNIHNN